MTPIEYSRRLAILMASDAPLAQRDEAIAYLRERYDTSSATERARLQIHESQPDISDIGTDHD